MNSTKNVTWNNCDFSTESFAISIPPCMSLMKEKEDEEEEDEDERSIRFNFSDTSVKCFEIAVKKL